MSRHLILFDGICPWCIQAIQWVISHDHKNRFFFAPLQGETAWKFFQKQSIDHRFHETVVLVENFDQSPKVHQRSQVLFRTMWLIGGKWKLLGIFYWFPPILFDWLYDFVASMRPRTQMDDCPKIPSEVQNRFLP